MASKPERDFLHLLVNHAGIPAEDIVEEYQFFEHRKWRADFFVPKANMLLEVEGGVPGKSRHMNYGGYKLDCSKYSYASALGYTLIRTTSDPRQMMDMAELVGKVYRSRTK